MKLPSRVSLILLLIFSLACSPVLAAINRDNAIHTIGKSNVESGVQQNVKQEGILIGQATKKRKGLLQRFGFKRKNSIAKKRQGIFSKFNRLRHSRKPKVQQKQKRQGFLSRFRFRQNRQQPKKQKRGFLTRFGIGRA